MMHLAILKRYGRVLVMTDDMHQWTLFTLIIVAALYMTS